MSSLKGCGRKAKNGDFSRSGGERLVYKVHRRKGKGVGGYRILKPLTSVSLVSVQNCKRNDDGVIKGSECSQLRMVRCDSPKWNGG